MTAWALARIAGKCVSMSKCIVPGKLLLRNIYRLLATKTHLAQVLSIDSYTRNDLQWWFDSVSNWNELIVLEKNIAIQLTTYASGTAWGGFPDWMLRGSGTTEYQQKVQTTASY